jgi:Transient receptor potential (TRP) ion channel/ML-like domain
MRLPTFGLTAVLSALTFCTSAFAEAVIQSTSLNSCQENSNFTATYFDVAFTPQNSSINIDIVGVSSITGNVTAQLEVIAYGFTIYNQTLNPCELGLEGMCPLSSGQINIVTNVILSADDVKKVPGIAYTVPDLDGVVKIQVRSLDTGLSIACMEADLSNTKTVYQKAVGWATAIIAGLGLIASGVTSGMGHTNTAAHVAANALSLFGFFQAQAIIGMSSVAMPPIVQSWTQNFQWSMGIVKVGFLQSICTWYQRATGGTPTTYLSTLATTSVQVEKRSLDIVGQLIPRGVKQLVARAAAAAAPSPNQVVVRGIDRVGFRAGIEQTNIFMTGLIFFIVILFLVSIMVALFKGFCELAISSNWMKSDKFVEFRNGWKIVLKGIIFRLVSHVLSLPARLSDILRFFSATCRCVYFVFGRLSNETLSPKSFLPWLFSSACLPHFAGLLSKLFSLPKDR